LHQYNFIRRAELAMALIMKDQNVGSVVGALFVSQGRYKQKEDGIYDIADGADYESKDKYWTVKSVDCYIVNRQLFCSCLFVKRSPLTVKR
jgi:hypothetical protein